MDRRYVQAQNELSLFSEAWITQSTLGLVIAATGRAVRSCHSAPALRLSQSALALTEQTISKCRQAFRRLDTGTNLPDRPPVAAQAHCALILHGRLGLVPE
jgi:hypothetical protein